MPHSITSLPRPWRTALLIARIALFVVFLTLGGMFAFLTLFPSIPFVFDFKNPQAQKNTLSHPDTREVSGDFILAKNGLVPQGESVILDASLLDGDYSLIKTSWTIDTQTPFARSGRLRVRRSYSAFFLPEGEPVTKPFIPATDHRLRSGSLVSFADGVWLIDGTFARPVGDADIFHNLGYSWEDVQSGNEEELSLFERGKMVLIDNVHPDGTVFLDTDDNTYFLIENRRKHAIPDPAIARSYLDDTHPVLVSGRAIDRSEDCVLHLSGWFSKRLSCHVPIDTFAPFSGNTYRFEIVFDDAVALVDGRTIFTNTINFDNLKTSLSRFKQRILSRYGIASSPGIIP
jgi:hypothetical protein